MTLFAELGLRYPIIQAPMAGVQDSALALAVTRAGALGSLPAAMLSLATLREELTRLAASAEGPFNINFFCHRQEAPDPAVQARWLQRLAPYYDEYGVRDAAGTAAPSRAPSMPSMPPWWPSSHLPWSVFISTARARVAGQGEGQRGQGICQRHHGR